MASTPRRRRRPLPEPSRLPSRAHPPHLAAAQAQTMRLITHVSTKQRAQIKAKIVQSIRDGITVDRTGEAISNLVGLFPRWQRAVDNLYSNMIDHGIPVPIAQRRARDYADELTAKRGMMIARTELMRAMNDGRLMGWQDMDAHGDLDGDKSFKYVQTAPGACPLCESIADPDGDGRPKLYAGIDSGFEVDDVGEVSMPPFHPNCRCTVSLIPVRKTDQ